MSPAVTLFTPPALPSESYVWLPGGLVADLPAPPPDMGDAQGLWWTSVVASRALLEFYCGLGGWRLDRALSRMVEQAADGLRKQDAPEQVYGAAALGSKLGHDAACNRNVELLSVLPWWAAGARASFALAALAGLPNIEHLHDPYVDLATHHHRAWRAGVMVVLEDEDRAFPILDAACGAGAGDWIRILAVAVAAEQRAS